MHSLPDTTTDFSDQVVTITPGDETSHDTTEVVQEVTNAADDHISNESTNDFTISGEK